MKLLINTEFDSLFSIDVDSLETVLRMKQKIEKAQGIPVCKQTLFFKGHILQDNSPIRFGHIRNDSDFFLYISPDDNPNQNNNDQTEQPPSNPTHGFVNDQGLPVMSNKDSMEVFSGIQDSPQGKNNQVLHQIEKSRLPSNSFADTIYGGDRAFTDTIMKFLIDTQSGSSFSIDVDVLDSVLTMKEEIEKAQGIPVRKQTLFLQGNVLPDHFEIRFCPIIENTRLFLYISPDDNPNQNVNDDQVPQTEQPPSNPIHGFVHRQDFPVMSNKEQVLKPDESPFKGFLGIQDSPQGQNYQALHQTWQSSASSYSFEEPGYGGHPALTMEFVSKKNQHDRPVKFQKIMSTRIDDESSLPSYSFDELLATQDLPPVTSVGSKRNRNQEVVQPEKSSPSDSVKEVINIPVSSLKRIETCPMKLTVMVQPYEETRNIRMEFNAGDKVEELRKELVKMQKRGELELPQQGYFFVHKQNQLSESRSFSCNGVGDGDTIGIFRAAVYP